MASFGLLIIVALVVIVVASILGRRDPVWLRDDTPGPWCGRCGYSLHGHVTAPDRCPECGVATTQLPIVRSRIDFRRVMRFRLWRWTWWFLGGFALFCFLLLPGFQHVGTSSHCLYVSRADDSLFGRNYDFLEPRRQWVARWGFPIYMKRGPITLMVRVLGMDKSGKNIDLRTEMRIDPYTWGYDYSLPTGKTVKNPTGFSEEVIRAWLMDNGIASDSAQIRAETAFVEEYIRCRVGGRRFEPANRPFESYWSHLPTGSWRIHRPPVILVSATVAALSIWFLGAARVRRRSAPIRPVGESG